MTRGKKLLVTLAVPLAVAVSSTRASADMVTFSNTGNPVNSGGTFTIGGTVVMGTVDNTGAVPDARIDFVGSSSNFSAVSGNCTTYGCIELATGAFFGPDVTSTAVDYLYEGTGSVIRVFGNADGASGTLYTGAFAPGSNSIRLIFGTTCFDDPGLGTDCTGSLQGNLDGGMLNATLAAFLNVNPVTVGGNSNTLFFSFVGTTGNGLAGSAPQGTATVNTNSLQVVTPTVIPEPGSMLLLGTGLLGFARAARRKLTK